MVALRRHHVFVLEQHLGGSTWLSYDANSGRRLTRIHARSIAAAPSWIHAVARHETDSGGQDHEETD